MTLRKEALPYFIDWLLDNVELVEITAYNDEDAYAIFESMNNRGLRLTPTEMLKGYLLSRIGDDAHTAAANELWRGKMADLKGLGPDEHSDFIKAWLRSQYARKDPGAEAQGQRTRTTSKSAASSTNGLGRRGITLGLQAAADFEGFIQTDVSVSSWSGSLLIRRAEGEN